MMELEGEISFSITQGLDGLEPIIRIMDNLSRCVIAEVRLSMEDYGRGVLTNTHTVPCVVELNNSRHVGKKREYKTEVVWIPNPENWKDREKEAKEALRPYEVDGWIGNERDATNSHCWIIGPEKREDGGWYQVGFHRFVSVTSEDKKKVKKRAF